jgi:hypothetical protein
MHAVVHLHTTGVFHYVVCLNNNYLGLSRFINLMIHTFTNVTKDIKKAEDPKFMRIY